MFVTNLSILFTSLFTGAAFYITFAEHPARMGLNTQAALSEWKPSYQRGFAMQASLAILAGIAGMYSYYLFKDWRWLIGAVLILANWPFTVFIMMPTNKQLMATRIEDAGKETKDLMKKWGSLHAVRTALGIASSAFYIWALS